MGEMEEAATGILLGLGEVAFPFITTFLIGETLSFILELKGLIAALTSLGFDKFVLLIEEVILTGERVLLT